MDKGLEWVTLRIGMSDRPHLVTAGKPMVMLQERTFRDRVQIGHRVVVFADMGWRDHEQRRVFGLIETRVQAA